MAHVKPWCTWIREKQRFILGVDWCPKDGFRVKKNAKVVVFPSNVHRDKTLALFVWLWIIHQVMSLKHWQGRFLSNSSLTLTKRDRNHTRNVLDVDEALNFTDKRKQTIFAARLQFNSPNLWSYKSWVNCSCGVFVLPVGFVRPHGLGLP